MSVKSPTAAAQSDLIDYSEIWFSVVFFENFPKPVATSGKPTSVTYTIEPNTV